jgi:hypothetical protein
MNNELSLPYLSSRIFVIPNSLVAILVLSTPVDISTPRI